MKQNTLRNPFVLLGVFFLICVGAMVALAIIRQTAQAEACRESQKLLAVLEFVPYELRADGVVSVIPTIDKLYDCKTEFFETDGRTTNIFTLVVSEDKSVISGEHFSLYFRATFFLNHDKSNQRSLLVLCFQGKRTGLAIE